MAKRKYEDLIIQNTMDLKVISLKFRAGSINLANVSPKVLFLFIEV